MDLRPPDGDLSIEMLKMVFGSVFQQIVGGSGAVISTSPDMLGTAFGVFNSAVLFFGSIIMTWVTVFGITNTAHDGEVLGKRWNTLYTPLRMTTASAVLIPGSTGYSGIQVILLWVVYYSITFASSMWAKVVDYVVVDLPADEIVSSVLPNRNLDTVGLSITKMMVCKRGVEQAIDKVMAGSGTKLNLQLVVLDGLTGYSSVTTPNSSSYVHVIGLYDPTWPAASGICGTLTIGTQITSTPPSAKTGLAANNSAMASATYSGMMTALSNVETNTDVSTAVTSLQSSIAALQMSYVCGTGGGVPGSSCQGASAALAPAIAKIITAAETDEQKDGPKPVSAATVNAAVQAFSQAFRQSLLSIVQGQVSALNGAIGDKLKKGGWANAGAVEREIARIKDAVRISSATQVSFSPGANSFNGILPGGDMANSAGQILQKYTAVMSAVESNMNTTEIAATPAAAGNADLAKLGLVPANSIPKLPVVEDWEQFLTGDTSSFMLQINLWTTTTIGTFGNGIVHYLAQPGTDPVMVIKNLGDYLADTGYAVIFESLLLKAGVSGAKKSMEIISSAPYIGLGAKAAGKALGWLSERITDLFGPAALFMPSVWTLVYAGYYLGVWIPMIPWMIFTLGVIGWLIQVVESLAAGSLWAVMHLTPANDDSFIGGQSQGYLLILSLFMRPPLMILGLVISLVILQPVIVFINASFITVFIMNQSTSMSGLLTMIGYLMVYCMVISATLSMIFALPQTVPDRILRWIGGGQADMGEQHSMSRVEAGASSHARTAMTAVAAKKAEFDKGKRDKAAADSNADTRATSTDSGKRAANAPVGHGPESPIMPGAK